MKIFSKGQFDVKEAFYSYNPSERRFEKISKEEFEKRPKDIALLHYQSKEKGKGCKEFRIDLEKNNQNLYYDTAIFSECGKNELYYEIIQNALREAGK